MSSAFDVIVLGLGGFGSAACYHVARRGVRVLGLEQFTPAHDRGSSHGETRIIRQAYFEHPDYVPLLTRAYQLWSELELEASRTLFTRAGLMISGPGDSEAVAGTRLAALQHRLPLETLTREEALRRFPLFAVPDGNEVVFEANAGYLAVEDCTRAHLDMAERHGADLRFQCPVTSWQSDGRTIRVRTEREEFSARQLILTTGAWASQCLNGLNLPLTVVRKFVGWFPLRAEAAACIRDCPTFFFEIGRQQFYGFPPRDGATLKAAEHTGGEPIHDPAHVERRQLPGDAQSLSTFLRQCLPAVEPAPVRHSICLYTRTPDSLFVIDRHPAFDNVVFGCGFSGHGFKFTPVIGEVLAELALAGATTAPISFLSVNRAAMNIAT
ncbi:MAG: N-methyl-L-tryptophan oxidase [Planctomycetaceae bacterium]